MAAAVAMTGNCVSVAFDFGDSEADEVPSYCTMTCFRRPDASLCVHKDLQIKRHASKTHTDAAGARQWSLWTSQSPGNVSFVNNMWERNPRICSRQNGKAPMMSSCARVGQC